MKEPKPILVTEKLASIYPSDLNLTDEQLFQAFGLEYSPLYTNVHYDFTTHKYCGSIENRLELYASRPETEKEKEKRELNEAKILAAENVKKEKQKQKELQELARLKKKYENNMSDYSNTHWMKDLPDTPKTISQTTHELTNKRGFFDDSECFPKIWPEVAIKDIVSAQTNQPATTAVDESFLLDCKESLETGLEFTQAALAEHDTSLGRTTFKNKSWAKTMEKSIEKIHSCIKRIDGFLAKF